MPTSMQSLQFEVDREVVFYVEIQGLFVEIEQLQTGYRVLCVYMQFYTQVEFGILFVFVHYQTTELFGLVHPKG